MKKDSIRRVRRYDTGTVELIKREAGFLHTRVTIAQPGVLPYRRADGSIAYEAKLPSEIFSEKTIASAVGIPVTNEHPPKTDHDGMVTPENYTKYIKGALGDNPLVIGNSLVSTETIFDQDLISEIESGKKVEVSIGFDTEMDFTPGEYEGKKYDAAQRNIIINHLAHTEVGRAGDEVRAHLDSIDIDEDAAVQVRADSGDLDRNKTGNNLIHNMIQQDSKKGDGLMDNFAKGLFNFLSMFGGGSGDRQDSALVDPKKKTEPRKDDALEAAQKLIAEAAKGMQQDPPPKTPDEAAQDGEKVKELLSTIEGLMGVVNDLKQKIAEVSGTQAQTEEQKVDSLVNERIKLIDQAASAIGEFKHDGLSNREIRLKVVEKHLPFAKDVKTDSLSEAVVQARYEAAMELARVQGNLRLDSTNQETRIDAASIQKLRTERLNMNKSEV